MMRQLITIAVPLLAPLALYLVYTWTVRSRGGAESDDPFSWKEIPWIWLGVCGAALLGVTLVLTSILWHGNVDKVYEPPRFEDGKRVPGRYVQ